MDVFYKITRDGKTRYYANLQMLADMEGLSCYPIHYKIRRLKKKVFVDKDKNLRVWRCEFEMRSFDEYIAEKKIKNK